MRSDSAKMIDRTVDVGIVCTLDLEAAAILRHMGRRTKTIGSVFSLTCGIMGGRRVAVVRSDAGRKRVMAATDALVCVHRPKWVIAAGFAVGLDDSLRRGNVLIAHELVNEQNQLEKTDAITTAMAQLVPGTTVGRLVSIAAVPRTAVEKRELRARTEAVAADQHSWTLARMTAEHGVRFLPIRVLVDDAARDAEPESRAVYHPSATYRAGGVVGAFMSGSGHVGKIWKIRSTAKRHAENLAKFLAHLLPTLG